MTDSTNSSKSTALTIFSTDWCPYCRTLKANLNAAKISYVEIDVDGNLEAAAFVESVNNGNRVVPTVRYSDGSTATNPSATAVQAKLAELSK